MHMKYIFITGLESTFAYKPPPVRHCRTSPSLIKGWVRNQKFQNLTISLTTVYQFIYQFIK